MFKKICVAMAVAFFLMGAVYQYPEKLSIATSAGETHTFQIDVADTPAKSMLGLMNRKTLPQNAGMIFYGSQNTVWTMWMKNTIVSLDMVFFSDSGEIVYIVENTVPYSLAHISSVLPVKGVLEVNAGTAKRFGIKPGDKIIYKLFD